MNKTLTWAGLLLGIAFVILAIYYWMTAAGSLPTYLPGYIAGSTHVHFKHGLASLILGLGLFVFTWFKSGSAKNN